MSKLFDSLRDFEQVSTLTLATTSPQGRPHAAPVYFVALETNKAAASPAWRLYFFSEPGSRHARDIAHCAQAAAALYPQCQGWRDIRGLQLRGAVYSVAPGAEWDQAWGAYRTKFPFVAQLKAVVARNTLYALIPDWMRLVDNRRGFGYKEEWPRDANE